MIKSNINNYINNQYDWNKSNIINYFYIQITEVKYLL